MWKSILETGSWQGEIWNRRKGGEIYFEWINISAVRDGEGGLLAYVGMFMDISRMHHARSELERLALHDALTNLPNRLLLVTRLKHALDRNRRSAGSGAVLFMDLDRFTAVNDGLGHRAGDELLLEVACRVRGRLRDIDTLARLGGDEFVIVLEEISQPGAAEKVAQDVIDSLQEPFTLPGGQVVEIGGSIGIAQFPADGDDPDQLIDLADHALYEAKRAGRSVFRCFRDLRGR
jgi:diguanylate cyclase (GGDEF)-like protein